MSKRKPASLKQRQERAKTMWELFEDAEPDISTERLIAMVADATGEDYGDVASLVLGDAP